MFRHYVMSRMEREAYDMMNKELLNSNREKGVMEDDFFEQKRVFRNARRRVYHSC